MRLKLLGPSLHSFGRLLGIGALAAMGSAPALAQYQLVWTDTFNGTSLDTSKWEPPGRHGLSEPVRLGQQRAQYYRPRT